MKRQPFPHSTPLFFFIASSHGYSPKFQEKRKTLFYLVDEGFFGKVAKATGDKPRKIPDDLLISLPLIDNPYHHRPHGTRSGMGGTKGRKEKERREGATKRRGEERMGKRKSL